MRRWTMTLMLVSVALSVISARARTWTSKSGNTVEAELDEVKSLSVVLLKEDGTRVTIPKHMLSSEDQAFVDGQSKEAKPGAEVQAVPDEKAFMAIMKQRCVRCHRQVAGTMDSLVSKRWVVAGQPQKSPAYTIIGKHGKEGGKYHNVSEAEKKAIHDFIANSEPRVAK